MRRCSAVLAAAVASTLCVATPPAHAADTPGAGATTPASPANDTTPEVTGTAPPGWTVEIFSDSSCSASALLASGTADGSGSFSIGVVVGDDTVNILQATATDGTTTSNCVELVTYVEDSTAPAPPVLTGTTPTGPANDNLPQVRGQAEAGAIVTIYTDMACTAVAGSGPADASGWFAVEVRVGDDTTTLLQATAVDAAGNVSGCSPTALSYVEDSSVAPPSVPDLFGASDTGESDADNVTSDRSPVFVGVAEPGALVEVFAGDQEVGRGTANSLGEYGVTVSVLDQGAHAITARATDVAGNVSLLSGALLIEIDTTVPVAEGRYNANRISPNGDGQLDALSVSATFTKTLSWSFEVRNEAAERRYLSSGKGGSMATIWNGRFEGVVVPNGMYHWELTGTDLAGNQLLLVGTVVVDTVRPFIGSVSVVPNPVRRRYQSTTLSFSVSEAATVSVWVVNSGGFRVRTFATRKLLSAGTMRLIWDVRNASGAFVPAGDYRFVVTAIDLARNGTRRTVNIGVRN